MRTSAVPSDDPADYAFVHEIRVRFAETDAMGIVHHSRYLPYLEEARVAYLRAIGHPYHELRASGVDLTVLEVTLEYLAPLRFDEVVDVHLVVATRTRTTLQIAYLLCVDGQRRCRAVTVHGAVGAADGRGRRLPDWVGELFGETSTPSA